ncbi:hypothetical protein SAMN02910298_01466 [Pseudobutyrivibrio sp. YE44]|uniref:hypothetical protein n=1 Tax=Pseudobutyrivibrio sp. YE44 TaxID=1520802 RepID=UPI00088DFA2D|nr:hypothetical protein [Pseudobutyrivibrio sp. YE44]SDB29861.1 hypothetical protein SAMN02910298_01466 [Pseudobutyrivibrio sp. YE44]
MEKNGVKKWGKLIAVYSAVAALLIGCGTHPNNATVVNYTGSAISGAGKDAGEEGSEQGIDETVTSEEVSESEKLFIVEALDMTEETIALYSVEADQQLRYNYNMTTKFIDKYGGNSTWAEFPTGTVVTIGELLPSSGALSQVQKSKDVWYFEDITKYKIDEEHGLIKIDGRNYKLTDKTKVYSDSEKILVSNISKKDKITVVGRDKEVISISVNTGHGYISLVNTSVFDGSMIFIGNKIVSMVNGNETIEVPEGTYKVTVANNGWGGSQDITVNRDENVMVNLDEMKGDGPSYCLITFLVTVPETYVYIDGKIIDTNEPQNVQYGAHKLVVRCSGYKPWNKTLIVNSSSAEITLAMESDIDNASASNESSSEENEESAAATEGGENNSDTTTNGPEEETAGSAIKNDYDYEVDYLSTISDLISNLMD